MNPSALFIITGDPRVSPRPAEAIRTAAGVGAWRKVDVTVYLRGPAVLALGEGADDLVDGDHFTRYLPILGALGRPVYVQQGAAPLQTLDHARVPFEEVSDDQIAALAAQNRYVLHFN